MVAQCSSFFFFSFCFSSFCVCVCVCVTRCTMSFLLFQRTHHITSTNARSNRTRQSLWLVTAAMAHKHAYWFSLWIIHFDFYFGFYFFFLLLNRCFCHRHRLPITFSHTHVDFSICVVCIHSFGNDDVPFALSENFISILFHIELNLDVLGCTKATIMFWIPLDKLFVRSFLQITFVFSPFYFDFFFFFGCHIDNEIVCLRSTMSMLSNICHFGVLFSHRNRFAKALEFNLPTKWKKKTKSLTHSTTHFV